MSEQGMTNLMHEERHFDPPEDFAKNANVKADAYDEADKDRLAFWAKQAETIGQYCKKGRPLFVEARLQLDSWEDKTTGKKVSKLRLVGENFQFLGPREGGDGGSSGSSGQTTTAPPRRLRPPSGMSAAGLAPCWVPSPSQTGHQPSGLLNEKLCGESSSKLRPQPSHDRCWL